MERDALARIGGVDDRLQQVAEQRLLQLLDREEHREELPRLVEQRQVERAEQRHRGLAVGGVEDGDGAAVGVDSVELGGGERLEQHAQTRAREPLRRGRLGPQQPQQAAVHLAREARVAPADCDEEVASGLEELLGLGVGHEVLEGGDTLALAHDLLVVPPGRRDACQQLHRRALVVLGELLQREDLDDGGDAANLHELGEKALAAWRRDKHVDRS